MKAQVQTPFRLRPHWKVSKPKARQSCFLIAYDGGLASLAALRAACLNAAPDTQLVAVYLDMVPLTQPPDLDSECPTAAQAILAAAAVNAALYGARLQTVSLECHVRGPALIDLAERYGNATIYLGIDDTEPDPFADYVRAMAPAGVVVVAA